jgi:flagellar biogenesis protein FliO
MTPQSSEPDTGLRRVLTWTAIALVVALLLALAGAWLASRFFDPA